MIDILKEILDEAIADVAKTLNVPTYGAQLILTAAFGSGIILMVTPLIYMTI